MFFLLREDICPDSFNIWYPVGYWKWPDIRPNSTLEEQFEKKTD